MNEQSANPATPLAAGGQPASTGSLLFSLQQFECTLARHGVIQRAAIEDPDGYDGGHIMDCIYEAYEDLRASSENANISGADGTAQREGE